MQTLRPGSSAVGDTSEKPLIGRCIGLRGLCAEPVWGCVPPYRGDPGGSASWAPQRLLPRTDHPSVQLSSSAGHHAHCFLGGELCAPCTREGWAGICTPRPRWMALSFPCKMA